MRRLLIAAIAGIAAGLAAGLAAIPAAAVADPPQADLSVSVTQRDGVYRVLVRNQGPAASAYTLTARSECA